MEQTVTIRFSHIDIAGIVFYARYFEILSELFPDLPFEKPPFGMQTNFLKPNYLGDEVRITFEEERSGLRRRADIPVRGDISTSLYKKPLAQSPHINGSGWSFTGRVNGAEHFTIRSLPADESVLDASAHRPDLAAFQADPMLISPWASDCTGHLQMSRFYELLNFAVEQWFARSLDLPFRELHTVRRWGTPTVVLRTRCREMPRAGDSVIIWIRPTEIGRKSLKYTCWLVRGDECLLENEQTIVFIKVNGLKFESIPIPDDLRDHLQEQYVAT